jgi:hypothetical protein
VVLLAGSRQLRRLYLDHSGREGRQFGTADFFRLSLVGAYFGAFQPPGFGVTFRNYTTFYTTDYTTGLHDSENEKTPYF